MKRLTSLIFLILFTNYVSAINLCDTSCNLTITFPDGGSITAVEPLMFIFGDDGLVDTATAVTAYVNGNTLMLGAGEVLWFDAGGSFDLGTGGNITYTNMAIVATGALSIGAVGGTITIQDMSITAASVVINAGVINVTGSINVESDLTLAGGSSLEGSGSMILDPDSLTVIGVGSINVDTTLSIYDLNNPGTLVNIGDVSATPVTEITIDGVLYTRGDGLVFTAPDGTVGRIESVDGVFVFIPVETQEQASDSDSTSASGGTGSIWSLMLVLLLVTRLYKKVIRIR